MSARVPVAYGAHPKPAKPERGTKEAREWMSLVAELRCVICQSWPVELHHCAHHRYAQRRSSDFDVIPLCPLHHRFRTEHGETWAQMYGFDTDYLSEVRRAVEKLKGHQV